MIQAYYPVKFIRQNIQRIAEKYGRPVPELFDETVNVLYTLLSFENFDTLSGPTRGIEEVTPILRQLARAVPGL